MRNAFYGALVLVLTIYLIFRALSIKHKVSSKACGRWLIFAQVVLLIMSSLLWSGCGTLIPQKRTENASVKTAEVLAVQSAQTFEKITEGDKPQPIPATPNISVTGTNNSVKIDYAGVFSATDSGPAYRAMPHKETIRATSGVNTSSTSTEASSGFLKTTIPLWVSLIGMGVGIIILIFAMKYARKSSPAIDAAWEAGDELAAKSIRLVKEHMASSTDPNEKLKFAQLHAALETERGKFNAE